MPEPSFEITTRRQGAIAIIIIDNPPVNAMSPGVPGGIIAALEAANRDAGVQAIVLMGGGRGMIAGADIRYQGKAWPEGEKRLVDLIDHLDRNPKPVVAALGGAALGGGLEIAQACNYRLVGPQASLGQPEVKLGIPPGAGGTQRLPRLVGLEAASEMILSGRPAGAAEAVRIGLADRQLEGDFLEGAIAFATEIAGRSQHPRAGDRDVALPSPDFFKKLKEEMARKARGQTAPFAAIECLEAAVSLPFEEGLKREREIFERCAVSPEARALRHVFFAEKAASKIEGLPKGARPKPVSRVGVIGAGTMGRGITIALLDHGFEVWLAERNAEALAAGIARINEHYEAAEKKGRITAPEKAERLARLHPAVTFNELSGADLIIEAVFEEIDVKRAVFAELAGIARPDAILATNTSYLDVNRIAAAAPQRRDNILGMHFFSPANIMRLLEIVRADHSSPEALLTALDVGKRLGKTAVVARVCHGFIGNRMFEYYIREANFLVEEGATPAQVDKVLTRFGMAMGPFAVCDLAGLDIGWARRKALAPTRNLSERYSTLADRLCERGWFGQKTGKGFYLYEADQRKPLPNPDLDELISVSADESGIARRSITDDEILERCLYTLINEGANIIEEKIAQRASDVDVVWIHGYGFPRHRGGPMFWADDVGLDRILARIEQFNRTHDFWEPAPLLKRLAGSAQSFSSR
ncbi:MAG: enoyl-CoA hydratase/isomerase family protein [Rhizobiales bacterium]|nr:enoyl-CoA hydratase/isomerase family protein [Hyphomicrobiales bacterium]